MGRLQSLKRVKFDPATSESEIKKKKKVCQVVMGKLRSLRRAKFDSAVNLDYISK